MRETRRVGLVVLMFILTGVIGASVSRQTAQPQSNWQYFADKQERFADYWKDFIAFAESHAGDSIEYEITSDLGAIAGMNQERINAAKVFNDIYENMSCEKDRAMVKLHLTAQLAHDVNTIDADIKAVNVGLSHTKLPAVSQTAIRMKDDLRDVRTKLDALKASLE